MDPLEDELPDGEPFDPFEELFDEPLRTRPFVKDVVRKPCCALILVTVTRSVAMDSSFILFIYFLVGWLVGWLMFDFYASILRVVFVSCEQSCDCQL